MWIRNEALFLSFLSQFFWQPLDIYGDSCYTLPRTLLDLLPRRSTIKFSVQCLCTLSVSDWKPYLCLVCLHCQNQILSPNSRSETEVFQFHKCTNLILSGKEKNEKLSQQMWFGCHERYAMVFRYLTLCLLKSFLIKWEKVVGRLWMRVVVKGHSWDDCCWWGERGGGSAQQNSYLSMSPFTDYTV